MDGLSTERIRIRKLVPGDMASLHALNSDPEVMRYINGGVPQSIEESRRDMEISVAKYADRPGLGQFALEVDSAGFIGWISLKPLAGFTDIEVGYRLIRKYWGKGYATEAAYFAIRYGFERHNLDEIVATTDPGNYASQHVLAKCGMTFRKKILLEHRGGPTEFNWYSIQRGEFSWRPDA